MKAMLLAAGLGTRLRPLTDRTPKPLIPVNGVPLIFYNLALLKKHGITRVVINLHHLGSQISALLGDGRRFGFHFDYSFEKKILGTGGGIKKAEKFLSNGSFLVLNGDIISDLPLQKMISAHQKKKPMATLALRPIQREKYGKIFIRGNDIVSMLIDPPHGIKSTATFFTGIHLLNSLFFKTQKKGKKSCVVREGYIPLLQKGIPLKAFVHFKGYWNDLGTIERIWDTEKQLQSGKIRLSYQKELNFMKKQWMKQKRNKD